MTFAWLASLSSFLSTYNFDSVFSNGAPRGHSRPTTWTIYIYTARLRAAIVSTLLTRSTRDLLLPTLSSAGSVVGAHTAGLDRQSDAIWRLQSVTAASRAPPIIRSIHP